MVRVKLSECCCSFLKMMKWWNTLEMQTSNVTRWRIWKYILFVFLLVFLIYSNVLAESLITGQMCSFRHNHGVVGSHGLLESTIYKRWHKSGPPSRGRGRQMPRSSREKAEQTQAAAEEASCRPACVWNRQVGAWIICSSLILGA